MMWSFHIIILNLFLIGFLYKQAIANPLNKKLATPAQKNLKKSDVTISGEQSFEDAISQMDEILAESDNEIPCSWQKLAPINFNVHGRRISEAYCLTNIWEMKKKEDLKMKEDKCNSQYGDFSGIFGGRKAQVAEFPHMGALGWEGKNGEWIFQCGSVLINDRFVLTAAHCTKDDPKFKSHLAHSSPKIVRLGSNVISGTPSKYIQDIKIDTTNVILHPQYRPDPHKYYDIALIKLVNRAKFNDFVRPACILNQAINTAIVSGWGAVNSNGEYDVMSNELKMAEVDIIPRKQCNGLLKPKFGGYFKKVLSSQLCAIKIEGQGDICGGDSGGPLQSKLKVNTKTSIFNVVGVSSFGSSPACEKSVFPSVYTNVASYIDWIEEVVWDVRPAETAKVSEEDNTDRTRETQNSNIQERNLEPENGVAVHKVQTMPEGHLFWLDKSGKNWIYINKNLIEKV